MQTKKIIVCSCLYFIWTGIYKNTTTLTTYSSLLVLVCFVCFIGTFYHCNLSKVNLLTAVDIGIMKRRNELSKKVLNFPQQYNRKINRKNTQPSFNTSLYRKSKSQQTMGQHYYHPPPSPQMEFCRPTYITFIFDASETHFYLFAKQNKNKNKIKK